MFNMDHIKHVKFVHFAICNRKHNPPKNYKIYYQNSFLLFLWGAKVQMKMGFMVLEIWLFGLGTFWDSFGNFFKEFV